MDDPIKEPLINFPCHFAIKVIGDAVEDFSDIVLKSISKLMPVLTAHVLK